MKINNIKMLGSNKHGMYTIIFEKVNKQNKVLRHFFVHKGTIRTSTTRVVLEINAGGGMEEAWRMRIVLNESVIAVLVSAPAL